jgi:rhodanese-related sulfurtransferase
MVRAVENGTGVAGDSVSTVQAGSVAMVVIDVRSPGEFASEHIRGSYNIPIDALPNVAAQLRPLNGQTIELVCRTDVRSTQGEAILKAAGVDSARVLVGGIDGWERSGLPLDRGRGAWSIERQVRAIAGGLVLTGVLGSVAVNRKLVWLAGFVGGGLLFAGLTDFCAMGRLLLRLPFNRANRTDVSAEVSRLLADRAGGWRGTR